MLPVDAQDNDLNMEGCRVPTRDPTTGKYTPLPGSGGMDTLATCLAARSAAAGRLKAAAPDKAVLDYRGVVVAWWNYVTPEHDSWWLKGDTPVSQSRSLASHCVLSLWPRPRPQPQPQHQRQPHAAARELAWHELLCLDHADAVVMYPRRDQRRTSG